MSPTPIDWSRPIADMTDGSFGIPTDVIFQIVEKRGRKRKLHEVKAHKMILGMVSPTFKTMFYATDIGDKTAEVIKIEETTAPAFQIMIDAVYNVKSIEASLKGKSLDEVFGVVNLIERYQITDLMEAVKKHFANYPITDDTVLEVAGEAMEYTTLFQTGAKDLLLTCAKFIVPKVQDFKSMIRYAAENQDRKEVFATLLGVMNDIVPTECPNCKYEVCRDGELVKDDEFKEGIVVTNNRAGGYWKNEDYGTAKVTKVTATDVTVAAIKCGVNGSGFHNFTYKKIWPAFLYSCN